MPERDEQDHDRTEAFLIGPRARRLCLELVADLAGDDPVQSVRRVLFELAYAADVAAGASVSRLTFVADGDPSEDAITAPAPEPEPSIDALAARITRAAEQGHGVEPDAVAEALRCSVDVARYWQAPDGEDIVAADPRVRRALTPIAERVLCLPSSSWWERPRTTQQWSVEWEAIGDGAPFDPAPGAAAAWSERTRLGEERSRGDRPADPTANFSGEWWSHPWGAPHSTGELPDGTPAGVSLVEDSLGWELALAVPVAGGGRTRELRDAEDWAHLCRAYPLEVTASRRHDWYRTTGRDGRWLLPDWARVASDWDAVHLTAWCYLTAATREIVVDDEYSSVIAGWGPDETYWLTGLVREVEGPRVQWRRPRNDVTWRRV